MSANWMGPLVSTPPPRQRKSLTWNGMVGSQTSLEAFDRMEKAMYERGGTCADCEHRLRLKSRGSRCGLHEFRCHLDGWCPSHKPKKESEDDGKED